MCVCVYLRSVCRQRCSLIFECDDDTIYVFQLPQYISQFVFVHVCIVFCFFGPMLDVFMAFVGTQFFFSFICLENRPLKRWDDAVATDDDVDDGGHTTTHKPRIKKNLSRKKKYIYLEFKSCDTQYGRKISTVPGMRQLLVQNGNRVGSQFYVETCLGQLQQLTNITDKQINNENKTYKIVSQIWKFRLHHSCVFVCARILRSMIAYYSIVLYTHTHTHKIERIAQYNSLKMAYQWSRMKSELIWTFIVWMKWYSLMRTIMLMDLMGGRFELNHNKNQKEEEKKEKRMYQTKWQFQLSICSSHITVVSKLWTWVHL